MEELYHETYQKIQYQQRLRTHLYDDGGFGGSAGTSVIRRLHAKLITRLSLAVQRLRSCQPTRRSINRERQQALAAVLRRIRRRHINDWIRDPAVFALIAVVRLYAHDGIAYGHIFGDGFLEVLGVEFGRVVVDVRYFDNNLKKREDFI